MVKTNTVLARTIIQIMLFLTVRCLKMLSVEMMWMFIVFSIYVFMCRVLFEMILCLIWFMVKVYLIVSLKVVIYLINSLIILIRIQFLSCFFDISENLIMCFMKINI